MLVLVDGFASEEYGKEREREKASSKQAKPMSVNPASSKIISTPASSTAPVCKGGQRALACLPVLQGVEST